MIKDYQSILQQLPSELVIHTMTFAKVENSIGGCSKNTNSLMSFARQSELKKIEALINTLRIGLNDDAYVFHREKLELIEVDVKNFKTSAETTEKDAFSSIFSIRDKIVAAVKTVSKGDIDRIEAQLSTEQDKIIRSGGHDRLLPLGFDHFFGRIHTAGLIDKADGLLNMTEAWNAKRDIIKDLVAQRRFSEAIEIAESMTDAVPKSIALKSIVSALILERKLNFAIHVSGKIKCSNIIGGALSEIIDALLAQGDIVRALETERSVPNIGLGDLKSSVKAKIVRALVQKAEFHDAFDLARQIRLLAVKDRALQDVARGLIAFGEYAEAIQVARKIKTDESRELLLEEVEKAQANEVANIEGVGV